MCPPYRPPAAIARSRFTLLPGLSSLSVVIRYVSGMTSAVNVRASYRTTVRQTPLTAMLSPMRMSSSTFDASLVSSIANPFEVARRRMPISSMMPVNMAALPPLARVSSSPLHRVAGDADVVADHFRLDPLQPVRLGNPFDAGKVEDGRRLPGADHKGRQEQHDFVHQSRLQHGAVQPAAALQQPG